MRKVLFSATVDSHILAFHLPYLKYFKEQGYEVHVATNGDLEIPYCDKKHKISFTLYIPPKSSHPPPQASPQTNI